MKVSDILLQSKKAYPSLEIVPPLNGISRKELLDSVRPFIEFSPKYINITCHRDEYEYVRNSDGSYSRRLVRKRISESAVCGAIQSEFKVDVVPHLICGGATKDQIDFQLQDFRFMEIENILALRGDCITGEKRFTPQEGGYRHANELVEGIREFETQRDCPGFFSIGVGGYPAKHFEAPNMEEDIAHLKAKVDAGADYVITQMFFDNSVFYSFVSKCREAGISVPIIPGLKPLSTFRQIELLPQAFSIDIPQELTSEMRLFKDDKKALYRIGELWCINQCKDLIKKGVPAVHFYTMGKAANVVNILRECF